MGRLSQKPSDSGGPVAFLDYRDAGQIIRTPDGEMLSNGALVPWRYVRCARHHFDAKPCNCPPGPQARALHSDAFEILYGGGRGSGKSDCGMAWLGLGNLPQHKSGTKADASYLNHPHFRFLVLRKNVGDLDDWFERAQRFFRHLKAQFTIEPPTIRFPSGAKGILGHMDAHDSYEKWQGQEFQRIVFEEIQHCPEEMLYIKIAMSCRSKYPELVPQIFNSANPGGPGNRWVRARFVDIVGPDGRIIEPGTVYADPVSGKTRVFFHATVYDNPYVCTYKNGERDSDADDYAKTLELLPTEQAKKQWLYGDFHSIEGAFFGEFREKRNPDEPEHAYHVTEHEKVLGALEPHFPRAIGLDWGYLHPTSVVWGAWHPMGRLYAYRELNASGMSSMQIGAEIAKMSLEDLHGLPSGHMTIYASHDAFWRRDERNSIAEQIKAGIDSVLGHQAALVLFPTEEEKLLGSDGMWKAVRRRQQEQAHRTNITIVRANNDRVAGWSKIRDLLRWMPLHEGPKELDEVYAKRLRVEQGVLAELEYRKGFERQKEEVLPAIRFSNRCSEVVKSLLSLVQAKSRAEDVEKMDGDDPADALRHLVVEFAFREADPPRDVAIKQRIQQLTQNQCLSGHSQWMIAEHVAQTYDHEHGKGRRNGVTVPRRSGRRNRLLREKRNSRSSSLLYY